jgi:hypothetical protein
MLDVSEMEKLRKTAETEMLNPACSDGVIVDPTFAIIDAVSGEGEKPEIIVRELKEGEREPTVQITRIVRYKPGVPCGTNFVKYEHVCEVCNTYIEEDTVMHCSTVSNYQNYVAWIKKALQHMRFHTRRRWDGDDT